MIGKPQSTYDVLIAIETEGRRSETIGWEAQNQNANEIICGCCVDVGMEEEEQLLLWFSLVRQRRDARSLGGKSAGRRRLWLSMLELVP